MRNVNEDIYHDIRLLCDDIKANTQELAGDISEIRNLKVIIELAVGECPTIKVEKEHVSRTWLAEGRMGRHKLYEGKK